MLCGALEETVAPVSESFFPGGAVLGPCRVSKSAVSEELFKGKTTCTFLSTMEPSARRCCGPGASSQDQAVQEYLKEEDYS